MKTIEELEIELQKIKADKAELIKTEIYEQSARLRDIEKQVLADIAFLKNRKA